MRVRYLYSACVVIESPDVRILCDPWFTQGAYDGAWYQYPPIADPIETIGPVDMIYVSHIHPDHYDPVFLRRYLERYPEARLFTGRQTPPIFEHKLRADGFAFEVVERLQIGQTDIATLPNTARPVNVDTALVVTRGDQAVINLNDNPYDEDQLSKARELIGDARLMLLAPYGGATGHPQTYIFDSEAELVEAAKVKERHFLDIFHSYISALKPAAVLPFAGTYWLAGPLAALNENRGVPDPLVAAEEVGERAVVLADGGQAYFDLDTMKASAVRTSPRDPAAVAEHFRSIVFPGYAYERELRFEHERALPLLPLLNAALRRARERFQVTEPSWVCLAPDDGDWLCFDPSSATDASVVSRASGVDHLTPRLEIFVDRRHLFGMLTRLYHWNNASIGSLYRYRRVPNVFRRDVFTFLDFLQV